MSGVSSVSEKEKAENFKGARSYYFEWFWLRTKLSLNWSLPENKSLLRWKNTKEITINHKGTRVVKNGEDGHGVENPDLRHFYGCFYVHMRPTCVTLQSWSPSLLSRINRVLERDCHGAKAALARVDERNGEFPYFSWLLIWQQLLLLVTKELLLCFYVHSRFYANNWAWLGSVQEITRWFKTRHLNVVPKDT